MPRRRRDPRESLPRVGYSFRDMLVLTKATRSNLIHWTNTGILRAEIEDTPGTGHARRFSAFNVIEAELAAVINSFRVPAETIRGGLNQFRTFHRGMVAVHAGVHDEPLVTDPPHLVRFRSKDERRRVAKSVVNRELFEVHRSKVELHAETEERVIAIANFWWEARTAGIQPSLEIPQYFLVIGGMYADGSATYAHVALDPDNLRQYISESAIVIDLVNVVFQVGKRAHGLALQPW